MAAATASIAASALSPSGPPAWRRTRLRALVGRGGEASLVDALGKIYGAAEVAALAPEFNDVVDRDWLREQEALRPVRPGPYTHLKLPTIPLV